MKTNVNQNSEELKSYTDYCKQHINDEIDNFEGQDVYMCDLGSELTQAINVDGSATYSTYKAKEYLKFWWDEAADYFQYEKDNFGQNLHNPFENPEAYHVCMIIEGVRSLLSQCKTVDKHWNDQIYLTSKVIKKILKEVKEFEVEL